MNSAGPSTCFDFPVSLPLFLLIGAAGLSLQRTGKTLLHALMHAAARHDDMEEDNPLELIEWLVNTRNMSLKTPDKVRVVGGAVWVSQYSFSFSWLSRTYFLPSSLWSYPPHSHHMMSSRFGRACWRLGSCLLPQEGRTPLHDLLSDDYLDEPRGVEECWCDDAAAVVGSLLDLGADPDAVAKDGSSPAHALLAKPRRHIGEETLKCLRLLISRGKNMKLLVAKRVPVRASAPAAFGTTFFVAVVGYDRPDVLRC